MSLSMTQPVAADPPSETTSPSVIHLPGTQDEAARYIAETNSVFYQHGLEVPDGQGSRLLTIHAGAFHEPISCTIWATTINPVSKNVALSYCWGDKTLVRSIKVNGHLGFVVTLNLFAALRRVRDKTNPVVIWVDMICIHQSNLTERGQQVSMMGAIFASAQKVLCWLGPCGSSPSAADDEEHCSDHMVVQHPRRGKTAICSFSDWFDTRGNTRDQWWSRIWTVRRNPIEEFIAC